MKDITKAVIRAIHISEGKYRVLSPIDGPHGGSLKLAITKPMRSPLEGLPPDPREKHVRGIHGTITLPNQEPYVYVVSSRFIDSPDDLTYEDIESLDREP